MESISVGFSRGNLHNVKDLDVAIVPLTNKGHSDKRRARIHIFFQDGSRSAMVLVTILILWTSCTIHLGRFNNYLLSIDYFIGNI